MSPRYCYTKAGYRTREISSLPGSTVTWLFMPGGPGMGSEAYLDFVQSLSLPGRLLLADFPDDGSNRQQGYDYNHWRRDLVELVESHNNVVIIAHSFAGMLVLATPALKEKLTGLVLMNSCPNQGWIHEVKKQAQQYQLPDTSQTRIAYLSNPSDQSFRDDILACAPYFFTAETLIAGKALLESLPYHHKPYAWAHQHFHPYFNCLWIPDNLPCLIIGSELDHLTPQHLFLNHERFQVDSIQFECIPRAGHYPWLDDFNAVAQLLRSFSNTVTSIK